MTIARISFFSLILLAACLLLPLESAVAQTTTDGSQCIPSTLIGDGSGGYLCITTDGTIKPVAPSSGLGNLGSSVQIDASKTLGCDRRGDIPDSVAAFAAIGGTYVPVSDAAVTRNTGYLVYKECVLDPVANKMRQVAIAKLIDEDITKINEGDNGNPLYAQNLELERGKIANRVLSEFMEKNYGVASVCTPVQEQVKVAVARAFLAQASEEKKPSACTIEDDAEYEKFLDGDFTGGGSWKTLWNFAKNPANAPLFAYTQKKSEVEAQISQYQQDRLELIRMGNGFLPLEEDVEVPVGNGETRTIKIVKTPGSVHSEILKNALNSPLDQQEMADEMDKVIDGGLLTLTTRVLNSNKGLEGITKPAAVSNPETGEEAGLSILDQILKSVLDLIQKTVTQPPPEQPGGGANAIPAITASLLNEQQFVSFRGQVLANLATTSRQLRTEENTCWVKVVQAVTLHANGAAFTPATTTQFSTLAISDVVTPIETPMKAEISLATSSIATLEGFLATLATSSAPANHQTALTALSQMKTDKKLHTTAETAVAQQAITDIKSAVDTRYSATIAAWKQGSGWCNASSTAVVTSWFNTWKQ